MKFPKNLASVEKLIFLIIVFIVFFAMINVSTGCNCTDTYKDSGLKIGIANPAAVYCGELGYGYKIITCNEGGQKGICVFPDKSECGAWNFFTGKCGQKYSYCRKHGYDIETVMDGKSPFSQECAVCVLPNRTKTPVTELMKLDERILKCSIKNESEMNVSEIAEEIELYLPSTFDWRNKDGSNWLTPVKDQGGCGSCWAFSAVGTVEPQYNIFYDNPDFDPDLSEQYLVSDCCADCGDCGGGWPATALEFTRYEGITDEVCFPYIASNCPCSDRCSDWSYRLWKINYTAGPLPDDIETIKKYLIEKGPLSVCMGVGFDYGGHFDKEIYKCDDDIGANHAVVIVGYNDTGNYWIVRNSWGQDWNEDGYFKVGYGECSIENYVYYANLAKNLFYCPASTNNADYEWIKRVELNGKEKNSGSSTYNNFTDEVLTTLKRGDTYTLYVDGHTTSSYLEFVKVWIDFNNNKDFIDLGEEIDLGNYTFEGDHIFSANFKVPGDAVLSDTRMRVYLKYGGEPDPCENASYGEIEDYTVEIISPAILTDNYSDYGIDTDEPGDGYYNYMAIDVGVNVTEPGYYTIRGGIYDELGNSTDYASNYTYLESGNHSITLKFSGIEIRVNGVSGTFNLKRLYLWDESYNEVDYRYDAYTTSYYNYTDFQEGGIIAGRVTYENGTGIYEAEVYASGPSYKSTYTNTIGYYSIVGLEAGIYTVTASPPYGINLVSNSTTASVSLGETTTVDLILREGGIIAGRVTYENGTGIYNARVSAPGPSYKSAYTNTAGYYSIVGLEAGGYTVTAYPPYETNLIRNSTTATVVLGETTIVNFTLREGGIIAGRVIYENGTGIYNAEVYASGPGWGYDYTNETGYYEIIGLEAGSYTATAYPPYGTNLIRNSTTASVTLGETTTVNFILQEGGIIAGRVTYENGTGIYNARVYAPGPSYKSAYTNITGYYSIIGLLGGSYTVTASPPYGTNLVSNSTTATVNLGETTIVNFVLREGGIIAGRVTYENGTGIYNAYVEAYNWTFGIWKYDYTNETGYYEIVGLEAGTYTVTAYPPYGTNLVSNTTTASVALSETTIVDIILPEAGIIAGRVTYENGTGIYNSYVYATGPSYGYDYTNITGYYSIIGLLAGNYTVTASPPYGTDVLSNSTAASVTLGETTVVDFVLHPPPDIWVYPMYFNVTLSQGNVTNRTLSIGNNGSGVLEFGIAEDALIITDPNEGTLVDIKNVYAGVSPTHVNFRVETYTSITEEAYGIMWLDADQNSSTGVTDEWWPGYGLNDIGGEYAVSLNTYYVEAYLYRWTGDSFEFVSYLPLSLNAYYFTISIPLSDIADDGIMDVTLMMEDYYGSIDIAPDEGHGTTGIGANWLSESPTSGTVDPDNQTEITVTINATDLEVGEYSASILVNSNDPDENLVVVPVLLIVTPTTGFDFDTGSPTNPYPSIFGMHNGTIKPNQTITVHKLYTYPCAGTGGHTERVKIWNDTWPGKEAHWKAYQGDWHNITFDEPFTLFAEKTYYYEIRTGSYPQIIHKPEHTTVDGSFINCTEFTDANGKTYNNWIPAIKLFL